MQSILERHAAAAKPFAIDYAHVCLIYGAVLSKKPKRCLELGIGTALTTSTILDALEYNGVGSLDCVDNFYDWGGKEPEHIQPLRERGAKVFVAEEYDFVSKCQSGVYDLLVSDGNHSGNWLDEHLRICAPGAILFFHDTNQPQYPGLFAIEARCLAKKLTCVHFAESTRPDEDCGRGMLMVVK